ncbi:MAG: hypothetical protein OHK0039_43860 [Bacteroidia bacterium]
MKALVLDYEEDILDLLVYTLSKEGFHTIGLDDEAELSPAILAYSPDLVILGNCHTEENRALLAREVRQLPAGRHATLVFLSTDPNCAEQSYNQDLAVDLIIPLPIPPREIIALINSYLPVAA